MASFSVVRAAIGTRLDTISGLHVYPTLPPDVLLPAAAVLPSPGQFITYDAAMGGDAVDLAFAVVVLVGKADDSQAQDALDAFLDGTAALSASSVKAAVDGTLGGAAHYAVVTGVSDYGFHEVAGANYYGATLAVVASVGGS